jgi:hypothetical protein
MLDYLDRRNENPKPFIWTADADLILGRSSDFLNVLLAEDTRVSFVKSQGVGSDGVRRRGRFLWYGALGEIGSFG